MIFYVKVLHSELQAGHGAQSFLVKDKSVQLINQIWEENPCLTSESTAYLMYKSFSIFNETMQKFTFMLWLFSELQALEVHRSGLKIIFYIIISTGDIHKKFSGLKTHFYIHSKCHTLKAWGVKSIWLQLFSELKCILDRLWSVENLGSYL